MLCNGCKQEIENDSEFCEYCGKKVSEGTEKLFCSSCGKQVENNSLFCKHCGASVGGKKEKKHKKTNNVQKIIIIALVAITCLSVFGNYIKETDKDTYEPELLDTGNVDENNNSKADSNYDVTADKNKSNKAKEVNGIYYTIVDKTLYLSGTGNVDKKTIDSFSKKEFDGVVFESGNMDIPDDTFSGFSNIKAVELRNYVGKIGARAFKGCGFDMIAIGKSVTEIGEDAFADCEIPIVYLNNPVIRANLNQRTDFGRLFEFASTIAVYYSTSQAPDDDFTLDESGWGQYLKNNDEYSEIQSAALSARTLAGEHYNLWARAIRPGFFYFYYTTGLVQGEEIPMLKDYNGETNAYKVYDNE